MYNLNEPTATASASSSGLIIRLVQKAKFDTHTGTVFRLAGQFLTSSQGEQFKVLSKSATDTVIPIPTCVFGRF